MARTSATYRLPARTIDQIKALQDAYQDSQAHIIILAIDRMYNQEQPSTEQEPTMMFFTLQFQQQN